MVGGDGDHVEAGEGQTLYGARRADEIHRERAGRRRALVRDRAVQAANGQIGGPQHLRHLVVGQGEVIGAQ